MAKSRILVIGATGNLGYHLAKASLDYGHPTVALVRESAFSHPEKSLKLETLSNAGAKLLKGSLQHLSSIIEAVEQVDVVICAIPAKQVLDQKLLIRAIKQAGCIKRFIPSEFGVDPDKVQISDLDYNFYSRKSEIRRAIESENIPYTHIASVFVKESDVAAFTISTVDDPRTLNKVLYLRPPGNVFSMNELVRIWETKIMKKLENVYIPEEQLLKDIQETPYPNNMEMVFTYSAFIRGDHTYFDIKSPGGLEGTELYPHVRYTSQ